MPKQWICDNCKGIINNSKEGYVVWESDSNMLHHTFKIIHQGICDDGSFSNSLALDDFLGFDGLINLTAMLSSGPVKINIGQQSGNYVKNMDEYVDFLRRVQIPYYEQNRVNYTNPAYLSKHSDANELYPYVQDTLKANKK